MAFGDLFGGSLVTPLGAPSVSTVPFGPKGQALSPQQIANLRQQALAMQQPITNVKSKYDALAHIVDAISARRMESQANQAELTGRQSAADALSSLYKPYLSPDASAPAATAGAAASGAGVPAAAAAPDDASAPRGIRNNNPLNIEDGDFAKSQPGYAGSDGRFAKFEDPGAGVQAADSLLNIYGEKHGLDTVSGIINRWAPQTDGNNTKAYVADVSAKLGIGPNDPIPAQLRPQLISAMAQHENGVPVNVATAGGPAPAPQVAPGPSAAPSPAPMQTAYAGPPPQNPLSPMISAIAGRPMQAPMPQQAMTAPQGAPPAPAPQQMAQAGQAGLPSPLTSATGQMSAAQLSALISNPYVPDSAKSAALQMIQQRGQPQTMDVEGGKLMFDAAGHKVFIPEPRFSTLKTGGGTEVPIVSHYDPATKQWTPTVLAPGAQAGGAPGAPGAGPDLSTIEKIQQNDTRQAANKKGAETTAEGQAKNYDALHRGLTGSAMIAAQQKPNIDIIRQIAADPNFKSGMGADTQLMLQRAAANFGIDAKSAAPRELFNQVAARILSDQMSGMKSMAASAGEESARIFKPFLDIEEKANITAEDSPEGIKRKVDLLDRAGNMMMKYGDLADDYVKEHGRLDAGFSKQIRKEIAAGGMPNVLAKGPEAQTAVPGAPPTAPQVPNGLADEMRKRGLLGNKLPGAPYP